ncbi:MAG: phage holin family protein [Myxococcota bacterium]
MSDLLSAAEDVVEAGQQAVIDRFELVRTEAMDEARMLMVDAAGIFAAATIAAFGWVMLAVAGVLGLSYVLAPWLATAVVALPHLLVGIVLGAVLIGRFRTQTRVISDTLADTLENPLHE